MTHLRRVLDSRVRKFCWILVLSSGLSSPAVCQPGYAGPNSGKTYGDVEGDVRMARGDLEEALAKRRDQGDARKALRRAEERLEKILKANPASRPAADVLGQVYYYQGEFGDKGGYERCTRFLEKVFQVDPEATFAPRYMALSYAKLGKARETVSYAGQAAALSGGDTAITREMNELKRPFQETFLNSWYDYGNYYDTPGAKLTRLNLQTYKLELVAQVNPQFEQDLAARAFQQMSGQLKMSQDAVLQAYLQKIVDKLVAKSPVGPPFTYRAEVVESSQINAMAFPGRILVNTGLIKFADSEAELVTVLSHELAHIYAHHSARALVASYQKRMLAGEFLALAKVDNSTWKEKLVTLGVAGTLELLDRGYSRGEEKEADMLGTHIAFNAGYNPSFMTKFFVRLYEANPKQPFKLLSTHPPTPERIEYTTAYLEAYPLDREMQIDSQEFQEIKKHIK